MVIKLKSILKHAPWSLVTKAAVVGFAWLWLPLWVSIVLALWWYFVPPFRVVIFGAHFIVFMALAWVWGLGTHTLFGALILAALFFLLIGIKDLLFISREDVYTLLTFTLLFFLIVSFAHMTDDLGVWGSGGFAFLIASLLSFLVSLGFFRDQFPALPMAQLVALTGFLGLVVGELGAALLYLPMAGWVRATALFAATFIGMQWGRDYLHGRLGPARVWRYTFSFLALLVLLFGLTEWTP